MTRQLVQVNLVGKNKRLQAAVLGRITRSGRHYLSALRKGDTGLRHDHAFALQLGQRPFLAVVVDRIEDVSRLVLAGGKAQNLRTLDRTPNRLTGQIVVPLAKELVVFAGHRPMIEPARPQSLEQAELATKTALIAAFRTPQRTTVEPTPTIPVKRIRVQRELYILRRMGDMLTSGVTTPDKHERLRPPKEQRAQTPAPVLIGQPWNHDMHQRAASNFLRHASISWMTA